MKKALFIALAACLIGLISSIGTCRRNASERDRLSSNQSVLFDTLRTYQVRESLNAASVGALQLKLSEFKEHRAADAALIRDLGLRLRRVEAVATTATESRYEVSAPLRPDTIRVRDTVAAVQRLDYRTPYVEVTGLIYPDRADLSIATNDTLVQVLHRVPRFKLLGIWFGTKGVRQELVSKNPHTRIVAAEYIEIKK